jgi:hypothetical protein
MSAPGSDQPGWQPPAALPDPNVGQPPPAAIPLAPAAPAFDPATAAVPFQPPVDPTFGAQALASMLPPPDPSIPASMLPPPDPPNMSSYDGRSVVAPEPGTGPNDPNVSRVDPRPTSSPAEPGPLASYQPPEQNSSPASAPPPDPSPWFPTGPAIEPDLGGRLVPDGPGAPNDLDEVRGEYRDEEPPKDFPTGGPGPLPPNPIGWPVQPIPEAPALGD